MLFLEVLLIFKLLFLLVADRRCVPVKTEPVSSSPLVLFGAKPVIRNKTVPTQMAKSLLLLWAILLPERFFKKIGSNFRGQTQWCCQFTVFRLILRGPRCFRSRAADEIRRRSESLKVDGFVRLIALQVFFLRQRWQPPHPPPLPLPPHLWSCFRTAHKYYRGDPAGGHGLDLRAVHSRSRGSWKRVEMPVHSSCSGHLLLSSHSFTLFEFPVPVFLKMCYKSKKLSQRSWTTFKATKRSQEAKPI